MQFYSLRHFGGTLSAIFEISSEILTYFYDAAATAAAAAAVAFHFAKLISMYYLEICDYFNMHTFAVSIAPSVSLRSFPL